MEFSNRRVRRVVVGGLILAAVCAVFPVHNRLLEAGMFAGLGLAWAGTLVLLGGSKWRRALVCVAPLFAAMPFILPGKPIDPDALRADYVTRLRSYNGTRYVWGGESRLGIDCSGLP